jgi:hypothetical protein
VNYWPGTKIPKSENNAFTSWKKTDGSFAVGKEWKQSYTSSKTMTDKAKVNITYSRKRK